MNWTEAHIQGDAEWIVDEDPPGMSPEDEKDYYSGVGELEIFVSMNYKPGTKDEVFEFEVIDYSGCVGYMQECVGIDYWLKDMICVYKGLDAGVTYVFKGITAHFTRGDGYTTDDDVEWYFDGMEERWNLWVWLKTWIKNMWWLHVGWHIRAWRHRRGS